jgi:hypothetical protein
MLSAYAPSPAPCVVSSRFGVVASSGVGDGIADLCDDLPIGSEGRSLLTPLPLPNGAPSRSGVIVDALVPGHGPASVGAFSQKPARLLAKLCFAILNGVGTRRRRLPGAGVAVLISAG